VTAIHRFVEQARRGELARVVTRVGSGWVVLGDPQILPGYCLLYPDPVVTDLNGLVGDARRTFLADMGRVGDAILAETAAERVNYEILGNVEAALHAHIIPRYAWEPPERRRQPVWLHDWTEARPFDPLGDADLARRLAVRLTAPHGASPTGP